MKGVNVCLDNVSFVLCTPFIIKEKEMASVTTLIEGGTADIVINFSFV